MVEVLVRFTEVKMKETDEQENYLKRIVDGDNSNSSSQPELYYEFSPMIFDIDDVARFNKSRDPNLTTILFKDGAGYVVKLTYSEFTELFVKQTGKTVFTVLQDEEEPKIEDDLGI